MTIFVNDVEMRQVESRDGKPYAKKETLKIHLKSKTQKCEPLLSNISREDLLKKVSNPEYRKIVEKKKSPVTAKELFDKHSYYNKLNYGLDKIVFLEQENKINYRHFKYDNEGYDFIVKAFYNTFKHCVYVPVSEDYIHVRYDQETIVTFTVDEFYDYANYFLKNESERMKIVNNAQNLFIEKFTWSKRAKEIADIVRGYYEF